MAHQLQKWRQRGPVWRDGILHFRRNLGIDFASDQAVTLELPQLRGQHLLRRAGQQPPQLIEAPYTVAQVPQDDALPFPANDLKRVLHRTGVGFFHGTTSLESALLPSSTSPPILDLRETIAVAGNFSQEPAWLHHKENS